MVLTKTDTTELEEEGRSYCHHDRGVHAAASWFQLSLEEVVVVITERAHSACAAKQKRILKMHLICKDIVMTICKNYLMVGFRRFNGVDKVNCGLFTT